VGGTLTVTTRLGQLIRDARHRAGLTLEDVADRVGVTPGALSHIESGRRLPNSSNAVAIADALGIPREEMLLALDHEHSSRRRSSAERTSPTSVSPAVAAKMASAGQRRYSARPIEDLFGEPSSAPDVFALSSMPLERSEHEAPSMRDTARWSPHQGERLAALERLADSAAHAIRTLRGLVDDEDPYVSREARRLLRELDVRLPEE
jgi:transcriptional regulator with XRE-family HTH domain